MRDAELLLRVLEQAKIRFARADAAHQEAAAAKEATSEARRAAESDVAAARQAIEDATTPNAVA